ncbi:amino acid permease [Nevskia soli]|jgi:APA family basic amino acid/polyamine antiporter|uniref:amino acid permease n=1 Tax=Nevskia soli TaxID=418856 RepID=UPI0015D74325|nr:amino acid permease [Nevskia soli]
MSRLLRTKSIDALIAASEEPDKRLRKSLGPLSLTALGIGAVIGSGIFTLTGTAAAGHVSKITSIFHATILDLLLNGTHGISMQGRPGAGPAITVSFILVAIACLFAGLCYAELASMIPIAGSAYTYAYAILGEIFAWIIGWDLILEYAVSNMSVAVGFSAYLQDLGDNLFGFHLPAVIAYPAFPAPGQPSGIFNIPALVITLLVTWVLVRGVKEGAETNAIMVGIKILAILIFCLGAAKAIHVENWKPFAPNGFSGILTGASIVFFTYIGFDSVSTAAEECKMPQRDLPVGIIGTLIICTILYGSVALVLTGIAKYQTLNTDSPVADALKALGYNRLRVVVTFGALIGMISSLLVYQYGQARIWFAMSRDGLLPGLFSRVHPQFRTPYISTWIAGFVVGLPAGLWDIDTFAELSNIGTLFAFVVVSAGVIVLRKKQPDRPRSFRVPFVPLVPILAIACCLLLMMGLPLMTWIRFFMWLLIGLLVYMMFGSRNSTLHRAPARI